MINGVDVSNNNGVVDMATLSKEGYRFVICKATQGNYFIDKYFQNNIRNAKAAGMVTGAYHFAEYTDIESAINEAVFFMTVALQENVDFLAIDIEDKKIQGDLTAATDAFFYQLQKTTNKPVVVYGNPDYFKEHFQTTVQKYNLWIANYNVSTPDVWCWDKYDIWQYSEDGIDKDFMSDEFYNKIMEVNFMYDTIVVYFGDFDAHAAIVVSNYRHCPMIKKEDYDTGKYKAQNVIYIGGSQPDRYKTFKAAATIIP
jgi:hypothetical protein